MNNTPVVLITGAARRIGAAMARHFHHNGYAVVISYRHSGDEAKALVDELNAQRRNSAMALPLDLQAIATIEPFAETACQCFGRIDVLINNASCFYPTPVGQINEAQWDAVISSNVKAAFFLTQALTPALNKHQGSVINLVDIYAEKPLKDYPLYSISKAAIAMLTRSLALELAPDIRVNGISPGAILWPENSNPAWESALLEKIPMHKTGTASDIAETALFLAHTPYITGQIIAVDGGRSLNM